MADTMRKCPHCKKECTGSVELGSDSRGMVKVIWHYSCEACNQYGYVVQVPGPYAIQAMS